MKKTTSLRDYVIKTIKSKIQYGELKTNETITAVQICEEFKFSRTPVRKSLIQLETDGALKAVPRKAYIVQKYDLQSKLNIYEIFVVLDVLAAILAIKYITKEDILKMRKIYDKINIEIKYKNYHEYYILQNEFLDIYIKKFENLPLIEMLEHLKSRPVKQTYVIVILYFVHSLQLTMNIYLLSNYLKQKIIRNLNIISVMNTGKLNITI